MKKDWIVLKFGGTSVSTATTWNNIKQIVSDRLQNYRVLMVCSALSQVSNKLERTIKAATSSNYSDILESILKQHQDLAKDLDITLDDDFTAIVNDLSDLLKGVSLLKDASDKITAKIMAYGELLSSRIGFYYLQKFLDIKLLDAREYLIQAKDDTSYLNATIVSSNTPNLKGDLFITQGFIGSNSLGETVLLGRGGSDTSASCLAVLLQAKKLEIWTDVPGIFSGDPKLIKNCRLLKNLDYDEAQEIVTSGAKVLHPRSIPPVSKLNIPLYIFSTYNPNLTGTKIASSNLNSPKIKAISIKKDVTLISITGLSMWKQSGFLAKVFNIFGKYNISINLVSTSESNITVTLDNNLMPYNFNELIIELEQFTTVKLINNLAEVALIGKDVRGALKDLAPMLHFLNNQTIYLISQSSSNLNLTFIVDMDYVDRLAKQLHGALLEDQEQDQTFGPSWTELFADNTSTKNTSWWYANKDIILKENVDTPTYLYSSKELTNQISKLKQMTAVDRFFYAIKANNNIEILKIIYEEGLSFECVSIEEVNYILKNFPESNSRILFTPNFCSQEVYQQGLSKKVNITIDNLYVFKTWPSLFKGKEILIRIDPGISKGHHKYVLTGGSNSKFGIILDDLPEVIQIAKKYDIKIIGLHAHIGSGIMDFSSWSFLLDILLKELPAFPDCQIIDLGGGLGVPEKLDDPELNLDAVNKSLLTKKIDKIKLWMEPGRYIVSNAGVLVSKIRQLKNKGDITFIGSDIGMQTLIRPALYAAHHEVFNLSRIDAEKIVLANIVGPICESGDIIARMRKFPKSLPDDYIIVTNAGAYGKVMSSNYTLKDLPSEKMLWI